MIEITHVSQNHMPIERDVVNVRTLSNVLETYLPSFPHSGLLAVPDFSKCHCDER